MPPTTTETAPPPPVDPTVAQLERDLAAERARVRRWRRRARINWRYATKRLRLLGAREQRIVELLHPRTSSNSVAHLRGWLCIHSREGAWDANTGNGYYGGLQAHLNWYGVYRMDLLSPFRQMAAAERAYRQSGYSRTWLAGQWPNTYSPCSGKF